MGFNPENNFPRSGDDIIDLTNEAKIIDDELDGEIIDLTDSAEEIVGENEKITPKNKDDVPSLEELSEYQNRSLRQPATPEDDIIEYPDVDIEMVDENEMLVNEVPKAYDVTGSVIKRESIDGKKMSIIGTTKKGRDSKEKVEDSVVMNLETGVFALGDSHEVTAIPGSGVEGARDFTRLFSEFKGVSKETLSTGSDEQIKEEFIRSLRPLAENFAAREKEITCSLVQMHENPDGTRTAVVYNVGDSMILKVNKETGSVERVGQFDQAGEDLFAMFVRNDSSNWMFDYDHPNFRQLMEEDEKKKLEAEEKNLPVPISRMEQIKMIIDPLKKENIDKLLQYFQDQGYQDHFDYFKCAEIIAKDPSLSDDEKQQYRSYLDVLNAKMSKIFERKNVTTDRVEVLHLKPGEVLVELSDGIIDNVDLLHSPEFVNAVKGGSSQVEAFVDSVMVNARKKDDFSFIIIE